MTLLSISNAQQKGTFQGSKYLKCAILCDEQELKILFNRLDSFWMFPLTGVTNGEAITPSFFLQEVSSWVQLLQKGQSPSNSALKRCLACAMTGELDALWLCPISSSSSEQYLVKMAKPVVLIQPHFFTYSAVDGAFRSMTMGPESVFWGIQLSFPQIYQDPQTMELCEIDKESPNAHLFNTIKMWVRNISVATPFIVQGVRTNVPMRLGKRCFSWINSHPQLLRKQIQVYDLSFDR